MGKRRTYLTPDDVKTDAKKTLYVLCGCGARNDLGIYGAAHVGAYELRSTCTRCHGEITISQSTEE